MYVKIEPFVCLSKNKVTLAGRPTVFRWANFDPSLMLLQLANVSLYRKRL